VLLVLVVFGPPLALGSAEVTEPSEFVTPREAAERLGVERTMVLNWLVRGVLQGNQEEGHRGRWRIPAAEVDRLARERERLS
jgi:excisionase family DNA binding protein